MFSQVIGETTLGIEGEKIIVEVDVSNGLPGFDIVGWYLDSNYTGDAITSTDIYEAYSTDYIYAKLSPKTYTISPGDTFLFHRLINSASISSTVEKGLLSNLNTFSCPMCKSLVKNTFCI